MAHNRGIDEVSTAILGGGAAEGKVLTVQNGRLPLVFV
jgi:hypothetical protein